MSEPMALSSVDPVCGMTVGPESPHRLQHAGKDYAFCCDGCLETFKADPERYTGKENATAPPAHAHGGHHAAPHTQAAGEDADVGAKPPGKAIYTCPMHPEVRSDRPGSCPKCGMALEPVLPTLEE